MIILILAALAFLVLRRASERTRIGILVLAVLGAGSFGLAAFIQINPETPLGYQKTLTIGGKQFLEQSILVELMARAIETDNPKLVVNRCYELGDSTLLFERLKSGIIDMYVEYTGTLFFQLLGQRKVPREQARDENHHNPQTINALLQETDDTSRLKWLDSFGFSNTWVLVILKDNSKYKRNTVQTISDLSKISNQLRLKATFDFLTDTRPDGLPGLKKTYQLVFKDQSGIAHRDKYQALLNKEMDVTDGYGTDPQLYSMGNNPFLSLKDDKKFFPPYYAAPIANKNSLERFPNVESSLLKLAGKISERDMGLLIEKANRTGLDKVKLNSNGVAQSKLRDLVDDFLTQKGLEKPVNAGTSQGCHV